MARKLQKDVKVFDSEPCSGRPSSLKPSCSETELNRCTTTEIRWNKNKEHEHLWSSPPITGPTRSATEDHLC